MIARKQEQEPECLIGLYSSDNECNLVRADHGLELQGSEASLPCLQVFSVVANLFVPLVFYTSLVAKL